LDTHDVSPGAGLLSEELAKVYGKTFADCSIAPVLESFTGQKIDTLSPSTIEVFGLKRVIAFDESETRRLKQSSELDGKIAHTSFRHGTSNISKFYPYVGGVGAWISGMKRNLIELGVEIMTGCHIAGLSEKGECVRSVELADGRELACGQLIWTTPLAELLHLAKREFPSVRPNFLSLTLAHLSTVEPLETELHYLNCFDTDLKSFRVTFYPNLIAAETLPTPHHMTVEFLSPETSPDQGETVHTAISELERMGVVTANAEFNFTDVQTLPFALPILTPEVEAATADQQVIAVDLFENLHCVGRSTSATHFQREIMLSTFEYVTRMAL
jgi:protoporphyrinogen oxidase